MKNLNTFYLKSIQWKNSESLNNISNRFAEKLLEEELVEDKEKI